MLDAVNSTDSASRAEPIVRPRMPELDTIRGIAILAVFVFHGFEDVAIAPVTRPFWERAWLAVTYQGWAGVNLFFVLSGFLITGILLDSRNKPRYYSRFYSHRALRILPPYYLLLVVFFFLGHAGLLPHGDLGDFLGLSFIYLSNLAPLFGVMTFYGPLWSLAVEEQFYLLWPGLVRLVSMRGLAITAGAICLIEPLWRLFALHAGPDVWWVGPERMGSFRYTWLSADGLALGALLAVFARSGWGNRRTLLKLAGVAAAGSIVATALSFVLPATLAICLRGTLVNYAALAIVAGSLWLGTGPYRSWANIRLLSFYGYISYGLYLIHGLALEAYKLLGRTSVPAMSVGTSFALCSVRFAICVAVTTGLAYFSRVTFEEFFLRMKGRSARIRAATSSSEAS